jgi:hypothetical protein
MEVTVSPDHERGLLRIGWRLDGSRAARYQPFVGVEGFWLRQPDTSDPWVDFPWSYVSASVPVELELRVVAHLEDGTTSAPVDAPLLVPPRWDPPTSQQWVVGQTELVVSHEARRDAGLNAWVDGCMGFAEIGGEVYGFAANGAFGEDPSGVARWRIGGDHFLTEGSATSARIEGETAPYVGGGPVFVGPDGELLLLYHAEVWLPDDRHPEGNPMRFWSFIGMATSPDDGLTWRSLGRIIEPELGVDAEVRPFLTEVCGAPYIVRDGHMYVYFRDTRGDASAVTLSVARAPVADVVAAAHRGAAPVFTKWHDGGWTEPALGGRSTDLVPGSPEPRWFDVIELVDHGLYVMVQTDGVSRHWTDLVRTSADGLTWSPAERLPGPVISGERLYVTLASPSLVPQRQVRGDAFDVYHVRSERGISGRWDEAVVERTRVQLRR